MSDYASGLPIRSEADGADERLHAKIVDGTTPSRRMTVDTDGNAHIEVHGNDSGGTDRTLKMNEGGNVVLEGDYDAATNTNPSSVGVVAHDRGAVINNTSQNKRVTAVAGDNNKIAQDCAMQDSSGNNISLTNPLPVYPVTDFGTEFWDYAKDSAVAAAASANHDYTSLGASKGRRFSCAASGKAKFELQVETAAASGVFTSYEVKFNSTAEPSVEFVYAESPLTAAVGVKYRIIKTNLDNQAQDLYSTMKGLYF